MKSFRCVYWVKPGTIHNRRLRHRPLIAIVSFLCILYAICVFYIFNTNTHYKTHLFKTKIINTVNIRSLRLFTEALIIRRRMAHTHQHFRIYMRIVDIIFSKETTSNSAMIGNEKLLSTQRTHQHNLRRVCVFVIRRRSGGNNGSLQSAQILESLLKICCHSHTYIK